MTVTWPSPPAGAIPSPPQVATLIAYFTGDIYKLSVQDTNPSQERIAGSTPSNDVIQCGLASAVPGEQCAAYEGLRGPNKHCGGQSADKPDFESGCDTVITSPSSKFAYCELMMLDGRTVTASWTPFPG